jgi:hypothetical protein
MDMFFVYQDNNHPSEDHLIEQSDQRDREELLPTMCIDSIDDRPVARNCKAMVLLH